MCVVGLGIRIDDSGEVEIKEFGRMVVKKMSVKHLLRRILVLFLRVQTASAAEIGNAAFCGHTGSSKKNDVIRCRQDVLKGGICIISCIHSIRPF